MEPYESLFGIGRQHFALDQVERRWAWFKRLLKYIENKFVNIFPPHWRIQLRLCLEFVEGTKMHLIAMLTEIESNDASDVNLLLKALQSSIRFEQEMTEKFNLLKQLKQSMENEEQSAKLELEMQQRLKKDDKLMYIPTDHDAANKEEETESGFLGLAHSAISGGISGVFDKFLGSYVLLERQNLEEMLTRLGQEDTPEASTPQQSGSVFASSTNMFVFIKNSIKRCTQLTTGQTFLSLTEELRSSMRQYIVMLKNRCPAEVPGTNPILYRMLPGMEVTVSIMINTGEYCAEVAPQLEQMVQQKIQPSLANKVTFEEESEAFMDLVAFGLKVLVFGVLDRLDSSFRTMFNMNWGAFTQVGEESAYLHTISAVLVEVIPNVRNSLSSSYFNNFCTRLATEILQKFQDVILRQKRITELATQQLLLDTYSMKTMVMQLPIIQNPATGNGNPAAALDKSNIPSVYTKLVNSRSTHIEVILKLVGTPEDLLLERFKLMWPEGQSADLQMLMGLKGIRRDSQQVILEMLGLSSANKASNKGPASGMLQGVPKFIPSGAAFGSGQINSNAGPQQSFAYTAASAQAASAAAFSSMRSLTQDLSSSARSAVGNLKWSSSNAAGGNSINGSNGSTSGNNR